MPCWTTNKRKEVGSSLSSITSLVNMIWKVLIIFQEKTMQFYLSGDFWPRTVGIGYSRVSQLVGCDQKVGCSFVGSFPYFLFFPPIFFLKCIYLERNCWVIWSFIIVTLHDHHNCAITFWCSERTGQHHATTLETKLMSRFLVLFIDLFTDIMCSILKFSLTV